PMLWPCWARRGSVWTGWGCDAEVRGGAADRCGSLRHGGGHGPGAPAGAAIRLRHQRVYLEGVCGGTVPHHGRRHLSASGKAQHHLAARNAGVLLADDRRLSRGLVVAWQEWAGEV